MSAHHLGRKEDASEYFSVGNRIISEELSASSREKATKYMDDHWIGCAITQVFHKRAELCEMPFGKCIDMIECVGGMGLANALEGNDAGARLRLRELEAWDYDADGSVCRAWIHASLGEMNKAYNAIFESIHLGSSFLTWVDSPLFDVMREDPRFDDLLRQLNMVR